MKVTALIPVKSFRNAKQRLSPLLGTAERELLAEAMFRDVLKQIVQVRALRQAYIVTSDGKVAEIASSFGVELIREEAETGETAAVDFARLELMKSGHEVVLIIPADVPLVRSQDIEQVLSQLPGQISDPYALLVPSHDRMGTNALILAPPNIIKLRFGYDSFSYHMGQVAAQGLPLRFSDNVRIALDIDEAKDLDRFLTFPEETGTARLVRAMLADHGHGMHRSGGV
jgi:2-phospho-L-lactate guanylyltransferase